MRESRIYAWVSTRTEKPVYVGKTAQTIEARMRSHRSKALRNPTTKKHIWLRDELSNGHDVSATLLGSCPYKESSSLERFWHSKLSLRFDLLNDAPCGSGNPSERFGRVNWTKEAISMLGVRPDSEVAKLLNCERKTVSYKRGILGIKASFCRDNNSTPPPMGGHNKIEFTDEVLGKVGSMPDYKLAEICGCSKTAIAKRRKSLGIESYASRTGNNGRIKVGESHRRWSNA